MNARFFISTLFPLVVLCSSCSVAVGVPGIDRDRQLYMDSVFFPYPDASIVGGASADRLLEQLERYHLQDEERLEGRSEPVSLEKDSAGNLVAAVCSDILFDFDQSEIRAGQHEVIDEIVRDLLSLSSDTAISLIGFTDSIGSAKYNLSLSLRRAQAVSDYITSNYTDKIEVQSVHGLGAAQPVASNATPEGRQKNRRVEIIVSRGRK